MIKAINKYEEMEKRHIEEFQAFPKLYASYFELELNEFSNENHKKEFEDDMKELGLKPNEKDKLVKIMPFTYIRKDQLSEYNALMDKMEKEIDTEIEKDNIGNGFIKDMFKYGILNSGFDTEGVLNFIGISKEEFEQNDKLKKGLELAKQELKKQEQKEVDEEME